MEVGVQKKVPSVSKMTMTRLWSVFVIISHYSFASCSWVTPSSSSRGVTNENVRRCYAEMADNSDISHLLLDVTSPEKIEFFCRRISRLKKCVADYEHYLSNSENTEYLQKTQGITAFYLNVCPPGTHITRKYKNNSPCFQLIRTKILSCGSDLPDMSSYKMKNDLDARCCALAKHRDCMSKAASESCGEEAAEVMVDILLKYFRPQLDGCEEDHCKQDTHTTYHHQEGKDLTTFHHREDRYHGDEEDRHSDDEWTKTTVAEEWKRHKSKHNSGEREHLSLSGLILCWMLIVFMQAI